MFETIIAWLNDNQGVLTLGLFLLTLCLGWVSGIFSSLMRKPRLTARLLDGPTFCCTFPTGVRHGDFEGHRTGVALYLLVSNIGVAPTSIDGIEIGYHWHLRPFSIQWLKYRIGWFWLTHQSVALADFQVAIGDNTKVYPFLTQINQLSKSQTKSYLRVGESTNGVVYFEQSESWGGCFPSPSGKYTKIKIKIRDAHGRQYISKHRIAILSYDEAKKFNPRFGDTYVELNNEFLPVVEKELSCVAPLPDHQARR